MNRKIPILLLASVLFLLTGCKEEMDDIYKRPDWLAGKVFTILKEQEGFETFTRAIELTGYDTIIDVSGSYTLFAPTDGAFTRYFQEHALYNSLEEIPINELKRIVKYHIVQNPWSKIQLQSLDVRGWIDPDDPENDQPKGFKRETLLLEEDWVVGVGYNQRDQRVIIVDTLESDLRRRVIQESRKYAPVFFDQYFSIYNLQPGDYEFYFDRPYEGGGDLYYAGAKIAGEEIFAENGFIYEIDRVVSPLRNGQEIMSESGGSKSYKKFYEVVNRFPEFEFNLEKTNDQTGVDQGLAVDSLFDLTYPELAFDIHNEKTNPPKGTTGLPDNVTIRYHHGLVAPTDEAFDAFLNEYLVGEGRWGNLESSPPYFKRIIANTHLSTNAIYPSDFDEGYYNGELDYVKIDPSTVVEKEFGSNCTFIGVNKTIVPRAFKSVTGPVFLQRKFSTAMFAIEASEVLPALKRADKNYMLFVESDISLGVDSSLTYDYSNERFRAYVLVPDDAAVGQTLSQGELRTLLFNHIALDNPRGNARKEFIENLAGNHIIVNNETGEVSGTAPTTFGFKGSMQDPSYPVQISTDADNGTTWEIQNWFSFNLNSLYNKIVTSYPVFHQLMVKAGLANAKEYTYTFVGDNQVYTVFVPSDSVLNAFPTDSLSTGELSNFLLTHFIQGELIFTDGRMPSGYYETARIDEATTPYRTVYSKIYLETGNDEIVFPGKSGDDYLSMEESPQTNYIVVNRTGDVGAAFPAIVTSGVIHSIDKVLVFEDLDSN